MTFCLPLFVYILFIVLQLFASYHSGNITKLTDNNNLEFDYTKIIIHVVCYIFCILIIKYLCNSNQMVIAWIIVFFPCIIALISFLRFSEVVMSNYHR